MTFSKKNHLKALKLHYIKKEQLEKVLMIKSKNSLLRLPLHALTLGFFLAQSASANIIDVAAMNEPIFTQDEMNKKAPQAKKPTEIIVLDNIQPKNWNQWGYDRMMHGASQLAQGYINLFYLPLKTLDLLNPISGIPSLVLFNLETLECFFKSLVYIPLGGLVFGATEFYHRPISTTLKTMAITAFGYTTYRYWDNITGFTREALFKMLPRVDSLHEKLKEHDQVCLNALSGGKTTSVVYDKATAEYLETQKISQSASAFAKNLNNYAQNRCLVDNATSLQTEKQEVSTPEHYTVLKNLAQECSTSVESVMDFVSNRELLSNALKNASLNSNDVDAIKLEIDKILRTYPEYQSRYIELFTKETLKDILETISHNLAKGFEHTSKYFKTWAPAEGTPPQDIPIYQKVFGQGLPAVLDASHYGVSVAEKVSTSIADGYVDYIKFIISTSMSAGDYAIKKTYHGFKQIPSLQDYFPNSDNFANWGASLSSGWNSLWSSSNSSTPHPQQNSPTKTPS